MNRFQHSSLASSTLLQKSVPEIYCSCDLSIIPTNLTPSSTDQEEETHELNEELTSSYITIVNPPFSITCTNDDDNDDTRSSSSSKPAECQTIAYFRHTKTRRANIVVPVLLAFENEFDRKALLRSGAVQPIPKKNKINKKKSKGFDNASSLLALSMSISNDESEASQGGGIEKQDWKQAGGGIGPGDGSDLWSSELDTLGETRGGFINKADNAEKIELEFECFTTTGTATTSLEGTGNGSAGDTVVERATILSTSQVDTNDICGIRFDVEIVLRDRSQAQASSSPSSLSEMSYTKTQLQIRSLLICTSSQPSDEEHSFFDSKRSFQSLTDLDNPYNSSINNNINNARPSFDNIFLAKQALDMGINSISPYGNHDNSMTTTTTHQSNSLLPASSYFARSLSYPLPPMKYDGLFLNLDLVPALTMTVKEISGTSSFRGVTLVSLIIGHSNLHNEDVTVTNIALHPGHSRLLLDSSNITNHDYDDGMAMPGGENSVINMTKHVRWGYAKGTSPSLPLTLKPQEAIATVIQINASENHDSRTFVSPIGVRGVVGKKIDELMINDDQNRKINLNGIGNGDDIVETLRDEHGKNTSIVMVSKDAKWTTTRIASEKTDAFRMNMSVQDDHCYVGAQVVVMLKVMNLSNESRNLTLVMANDEIAKIQEQEQQQSSAEKRSLEGMSFVGANIHDNVDSSHKESSQYTPIGVNNAVVCEVSGYAFGVWGLGKDDGTVRYSRDHDLLAVDAALLLGEIKPQHSIDAELRFVPLREGSLNVPNLRLFDSYYERWYDCIHTLKITTNKPKQ